MLNVNFMRLACQCSPSFYATLCCNSSKKVILETLITMCSFPVALPALPYLTCGVECLRLDRHPVLRPQRRPNEQPRVMYNKTFILKSEAG